MLETTVAVCTYKPKSIQLAEMITVIKSMPVSRDCGSGNISVSRLGVTFVEKLFPCVKFKWKLYCTGLHSILSKLSQELLLVYVTGC